MSSINLEDLSLHSDGGEEGFSFDFEEDGEVQNNLRWCLVGRFLCDRPIHAGSMMVRIADLWKPMKKVAITEAKPDIFLFQFGHPLDMEAVIQGGPWTFDNYLLILEQIPLGMQIDSIPLQHVDLWVQIHNLPTGLMREAVGIKLANYIGKFVEYDKNNNSSFWRQYMRVKDIPKGGVQFGMIWKVIAAKGVGPVTYAQSHVGRLEDRLHDGCRIVTAAEVVLEAAVETSNNKEHRISATQVGFEAQHMWEEWISVHTLETPTQQHPQDNPTSTWQPPPLGKLKCNVDASFFKNAGACGWGWCIRGSNGQFILAGSNILFEKLNIMEGEAMAIKEAMCESIQRGFTQVIFESDSKLVVDAILTRNVGVSELYSIISCIQSMLLSHPNFEVKFVKRQANMVAHTLARAAYSKSSRYIYDSIPPCICNILNNEKS
ncbi:hypothetical protein TSUD_176750 [Trifolium subterraneum]|uniref:RNase H type-1 domain-containing protein n=1 Tax=Trifolium subterraneum TaxID=3900 RepID=A0A2Z6MS86_TRISU|nr:hypothetical protein TSUD_176750 [Trifolium subterraneum]